MTRQAKWRWLGVSSIALALLLGAVAYSTLTRGGKIDCPSSRQAVLVVDTAKHSLALCENGTDAGTFAVRIGKRGTGKSREGDGKTPLGRYALGESRASTSFGLFIPVGYPTAEQRRQGYTGGAVGVHGPDRRVRWLGAVVNAFDTTDGCVGLATDAETERVAKWVHERRATEILVR